MAAIHQPSQALECTDNWISLNISYP